MKRCREADGHVESPEKQAPTGRVGRRGRAAAACGRVETSSRDEAFRVQLGHGLGRGSQTEEVQRAQVRDEQAISLSSSCHSLTSFSVKPWFTGIRMAAADDRSTQASTRTASGGALGPSKALSSTQLRRGKAASSCAWSVCVGRVVVKLAFDEIVLATKDP